LQFRRVKTVDLLSALYQSLFPSFGKSLSHYYFYRLMETESFFETLESSRQLA